MEKNSLLKIMASYLKQHIKIILLFSMFSVIFGMVFSLYRLETEAVLYAVLLCVCVGAVLILIDFILYYKRHVLLLNLKEKIVISLDELPLPYNLIEDDYIHLIQTIHNEKIRIISEADSRRKDAVEYYTLWVHQIKSPIAAMRLLFQADDNTANDELSAELFKIERYVDMVLTYLRLGIDSTDLLIKNYSLDEIVRQAVRKYSPLFVRKRINLDFKPINCEVLTDEKWLSFVIEQILSNAIKYTNKGQISIYMQNAKTLVIEDTGIGIATEDLPRIGEKSFTGCNGRWDKKATGLGLYLCKRILAKLSHTMSINSEVGIGTKIMICLDAASLFVE